MNGGRVIFFTIVVVTALVSGTLIAYAQSNETLAPSPLGDRAMRGSRFPPPMLMQRGMFPFPPPSSPTDMCLDGVARFAGLLAYVRAKLGLTPSQLGVWREVATAFNDTEKEQRETCAQLPAKFEPPSVPEMLKIAEEQLAIRQRQLQKMAPAVRKLYEALSADQRKTLDGLIPPPMSL